MPFSRRSLLGRASGGAAGLFAALHAPSARAEQRPVKAGEWRFGKRPKNIIFCVADGMALSSVTMADHYQQIVHGRRSFWSELMDREYASVGLQDCRSLNSLVTDSSAASSTWGSGRRIWNGQVNQFPDGTKLTPITQLLKAQGVRSGLVTTATITHATPAGFAVSVVQRDLEALIAEEYLKSGVDVLMGGGNRFFSADLRKDKKDLYADFARAGYAIARTKGDLAAASVAAEKTGKLLGVFDDGHLPFTVDHVNDPKLRESRPTLAEMARVALDRLKGSKDGFLLQIEGARVDHGGHADDLGALLFDQIAFEEAVKEAVEFALKDGETLVIVTADHATGGPALNGSGAEYIDSTAGLRRAANFKASYGTLLKGLGQTPGVEDVRDAIAAKLEIELTPAEAQAVVGAMNGESPFGASEFYKPVNATLAAVLGNHTKVTWTSLNHTSDHVLVTAVGPGREAVLGLTPNHRFFDLMLAAKGLKFENPPQMDFETARKHYEKLKIALATSDLHERYAVHAEGDDDCACAASAVHGGRPKPRAVVAR